MDNQEIKNLLQNQFSKLEKIKPSDNLETISTEDSYVQRERVLRIHSDTCEIIKEHLGEKEAAICERKINKISTEDKLASLKAYLKVLIENL